MTDVPEKEAYKVTQTKTPVHSFTFSSRAGQPVQRQAHGPTSNLAAQHAFWRQLLPSGYPPQLYLQSATLAQLTLIHKN